MLKPDAVPVLLDGFYFKRAYATRSLYDHLLAVIFLLEFNYFGMNCFVQWSAIFTIMALAILFMCIIICTIILGRALAQSPVLAYSYP